MSKYEVGYKAVIEVDKVFEQDGEKLYRAKGMKSLVFDGKGLDKLKPLSAYTETLKKEAEENYRMGVNAEYENWKEHLSRIRAVWQNEAWELALKLRYMDYEDKLECFGLKHDGEEKWVEIMEKYTYQEAAAKVAQWEKAKEEIKRGDIIRNKYSTSSKFCVTDIGCDGHLYGVGRYGLTYSNKNPEDWEKTGRHIDIDGFLKQIRGEQE